MKKQARVLGWQLQGSGCCREICSVQCLIPSLTDEGHQHELRHCHLRFDRLHKLDPFLPSLPSAGEDTNFTHSISAAAFVNLASALPAALACEVCYF